MVDEVINMYRKKAGQKLQRSAGSISPGRKTLRVRTGKLKTPRTLRKRAGTEHPRTGDHLLVLTAHC